MQTFGDLFTKYYQRHALVRTRCPENAYYFIKVHGARWNHVPISDITRGDVQDWCDQLGAKSQSSAKRAVDMMSAVINWGIRRGYVTVPNPCLGVETFKLKPRDRFLHPHEFERFRRALEQEESTLRDFFWMCLLTGARKGNCKAMRWSEVDLLLAVWTFDTKNGERLTLPLSEAALEILRRRYIHKASDWVFPGKGQRTHLMEPKRAWARVLKRANIANLRIHDLRRTVGTYLAIKGASPYLIGRALGHKDPRSSLPYIQLQTEEVRVAFEGIQSGFMS